MSASPALLDTLASYVPARIVRRIAEDPALPTEPIAERFPAAVFFADISGFTQMAERLGQSGPSGAEELRRLINVYFDKLIALITGHGGDIIKFAGDALFAIWPASPRGETLSTVTLRAAQCALDTQKRLNNYPAAEDWKLFLRVGVEAGDVLAAHVGGERGRWEYLLTGEPVVQVGLAEHQAQRGEVVLGPQAWALIQDNCSGQALPGGSARLEEVRAPIEPRPAPPLPSLPPEPEVESALKAYIPAAITRRLAAGQNAWLAELRRITVLFVQIVGLEHAPTLERLQTVMHSLQTVLYQYEGSVRQFILDDKGAVLIGALGLPPLAHEDDAARGVQAALDMRARLAELGLTTTIGITTGKAFCGSVGSATRSEYALVGDVVNLAARLMQAAMPPPGPPRAMGEGGGVLCDAPTYQAARGRLAFEPLTAIPVKGKEQPVAIYRPRGQAQEVARWPTAMVGRAAERGQLAQQLEALKRGEAGAVVVVEGEPGIGKSRLVDHALRQAESLGLPVFSGAGDAIAASTPYHGWRMILRRALDIAPNTDPETRRQRLLDRLAYEPEWFSRTPLLRNVLGLDLPDNDLTALMTGQVRADNTRDLILHLLNNALQRARQAGLMVILEDAHLLDSASWAVALALSQRIATGLPLLLIAALRPLPEPQPPEYRQMLDLPVTRRLQLGPLPPDEALALVSQRLGVAVLPEPVAEIIRAKAEGHPLLSEELAYALLDAGVIVVAEGRCRLTRSAADLRDLSFPDSAQGAMMSRLDRLAPGEQLALKVASVIGRVFSVRLLRDIYPIDADRQQLAGTLAALERLDLIAPVSPEPNPAYTFKHTITREAAYNLMLFEQRRELHRAVAEWYERAHAHDLSSHYPLLAQHWSKAGNADKALDYLENAGEQALDSGAYQEAVSFFSEALRLEVEQRQRRTWERRSSQIASASVLSPSRVRLQRGRWMRRLGEARYGLGQLPECRQHLERAVAILGQPMPATPVQLAIGLSGQIARRLLRRVWPVGEPAAPHPPERQAFILEMARAYERLAQIHYFANNSLRGLYAMLSSLSVAERAGPSPELARAYAGMCVAAGVFSLPALAQAYRRRALRTIEQMHDLDAEAWVLSTLGNYATGAGEWAEAEASIKRAVEVFGRLGARRDWGNNVVALCWVDYFRGQFAQGAQRYRDLHAQARESHNVELQAWSLAGEALHALRLGQTDQAVSQWEQALPMLATVAESRVTEILSHGGMAIAYLRRGESSLAWQSAGAATRLIRQSPATSFPTFDGFAGAAEVYLSLWEAEGKSQIPNSKIQMQTSAQQACKALQNFARAYPVGQPRARLYQGWYEWLEGKPIQAFGTWQTSLGVAGQLAMPYEQGLAHYEIGRHASGEERQKHLSRALEIFEQLGAAYDAGRARAQTTPEKV
ncbi:MAG: putative adenylate/guanylate cyclase [Anaerolineales bacterium]|nr:putative adenylate/guanylate cyclase [Anaerolineales bacterium]